LHCGRELGPPQLADNVTFVGPDLHTTRAGGLEDLHEPPAPFGVVTAVADEQGRVCV